MTGNATATAATAVTDRRPYDASMTETVLSTRALNRALLARQLLLERSPLPVTDALEQVGGLQTQYAPSGYIGLWSRLRDFRRAALTEALVDRRVIQGTLIRSTIHMVSAADWPLFAAGTRNVPYHLQFSDHQNTGRGTCMRKGHSRPRRVTALLRQYLRGAVQHFRTQPEEVLKTAEERAAGQQPEKRDEQRETMKDASSQATVNAGALLRGRTW